MNIKKILLGMGTLGTMAVPIAAAVSCGSSVETRGIYASRTANIDNLVALGYQPSFVNQQFDGATLPSYLTPYVKKNVTEKLHDRPTWDQTVDAENIAAKGIKNAFIAGFQGKLYKQLNDAGINKDHIGFTTMGETYIPDMDFRLENMSLGGKIARDNWNKQAISDGVWGKARPTSADFTSTKELVPVSGTANEITVDDGRADSYSISFDYTSDVKTALDITAETIDRITGKTDAVTKAKIIDAAFDIRISDLHTKANIGSKTALAIKPNYKAQNINEIIDPHFAWDPTVNPFLYSEKNGVGYEFPKYNQGNGTIKYFLNDVDGLAMNDAASVKAAFAGQVDDLIFLKPSTFAFSDSEIQNELKSLTKSGLAKDVHVVSESQYYQANFGMIGYFTLMDQYANDFNIPAFKIGTNNWGWTPTKAEDLKLYI